MLDYLRRVDPLPRAVRQFVRQREVILRRAKANVSEEDLAAAMGMTIERYRRFSQIVNSSEADQHGGSARIADADPPDAYTLTLRRELNDAPGQAAEA